MPTYNAAHFNPPAPVTLVKFINPASKRDVADVLMLIDSGSDATLVPRQIVDALSIVTTQETLAVELVNGERSALQVVRMQMKWDRYTVNGEFLVTDGDFGIIGRDILNRVRLLLNGPAQTWSFT